MILCRLAFRVPGIVLSSPKTGRSSNDGAVLDGMAIDEITVPTLISSHEQDECEWTLFHNARRLVKRLTRSTKADIVSFRGGSPSGFGQCGISHYHSYEGIEQEVVNRIANWIKDTLRRPVMRSPESPAHPLPAPRLGDARSRPD